MGALITVAAVALVGVLVAVTMPRGPATAELPARRDLALEWFDLVDAPIKRVFTFENAAHAPAFEHFEAFSKIMSETILPETYER